MGCKLHCLHAPASHRHWGKCLQAYLRCKITLRRHLCQEFSSSWLSCRDVHSYAALYCSRSSLVICFSWQGKWQVPKCQDTFEHQ